MLVTKYRHKCINDDIFNYMKQHINRVVSDWGGSLDEINHDFDHIHMLLSLPPQQAPQELYVVLKQLHQECYAKSLMIIYQNFI